MDTETMVEDVAEPRVPSGAVGHVAGLVSDIHGNPWPFCSIQCVLLGLKAETAFFLGDGTPVTIFYNTQSDAGGNFALQLALNTVITPPNTLWQITFTPQGSSSGTSTRLLVNNANMGVPTVTAPFSDDGKVKLVRVANSSAASQQSATFPNNIYWWA